jgi:hypothetical protein
MKIEIAPAAATLTKYTHAAPESAAKDLVERIAKLEAAGHTVIAATSARSSVPNAYRSAYKMLAPVWVYRPETREISLVSAKLQNRPRGAAIPAHIYIHGSETPAGYRALVKRDNSIDLIPA